MPDQRATVDPHAQCLLEQQHASEGKAGTRHRAKAQSSREQQARTTLATRAAAKNGMWAAADVAIHLLVLGQAAALRMYARPHTCAGDVRAPASLPPCPCRWMNDPQALPACRCGSLFSTLLSSGRQGER